MPRGAAKSGSTTLTADMRIVVLHGSDSYLIRERTRQLTEALQEAFGQIEQFGFDGAAPGVDAAAILDELRSYGLMQQHKLVIVDNADAFLSGRKSGEEEGEDEDEPAASPARRLMEKYAESPVPDATLLMRAGTWRAGKLDKRIAKVGAIVKCVAPTEDRAITWCQDRCEKRYGCTLDRSAANLLVQRIGADLSMLDMELQKLAALQNYSGRIGESDVRLLTPMSRQEKAWQIQDALLTGRADVALEKLHELLDVSRQDVVPLMWSVIDLVRKLHGASHMLRQGESEKAINSQLRLWGPAARVVLNAARKLEPADLARLMQAAIDADRRFKSGRGDPLRSLEGAAVLVADTIHCA